MRAAEEEPRLEEQTATALEKLRPLLDSKNWDAAIALIAGLQAKVGPESFDMAFLKDIEAKIYLQKGDYDKVIAPWEISLRLHDTKKYLSEDSIQEIVYYLAQILYQEAAASKDPGLQKRYFAKATGYIERWLANTNKPPHDTSRQEAAMFYALLLYNQGSIDSEHVDMKLINRAEVEAEKGLRLSPHPKDTFYLLLLSIAQQKGDYPRLADILELLVKKTPAKKDYWSQLAGVYLNLAAQEKDETKAREYNTRAIVAIERAQALGFMKTPKDNYTLVGIYFNVGQYGRATELLHAGLRDGSIENEQKNWELLAYSYQQVDQPFKAIDALKEATKAFPDTGQLDYQMAQIYYSLNKPNDAYNHLRTAISKGHLEKPGAVNSFLGYVAWELQKFPEALEAINNALETPEGKKDKQLPAVKQAVEEAIRERAAQSSGTAKK